MRVFIENEAGSDIKHTYDEQSLALLRTAKVSAAYPFPYGFVMGTRSGDGDAVDCFLIVAGEPARSLTSGTVIACEPAALLEQIEDGEVDHKILAVLPGARLQGPDVVAALIQSFATQVFAHIPGKVVQVGRLLDRAAAEAFITASTPPGQNEGRPLTGARDGP